MSKISKGLRGLRNYCLGHFYALFFYDKKYLRGKWFSGKLDGLCSQGWEWVFNDARERRLNPVNKAARFPICSRCTVVYPENVEFDPDDLNNFKSFGIYYQAVGKIKIGRGTFIGPNVGLITANHDVNDLNKHQEVKSIILGDNCWIGMNSVILHGVILGDNTVVGAGSVVTHSFEKGKVVIAGNPAKIIKEL